MIREYNEATSRPEHLLQSPLLSVLEWQGRYYKTKKDLRHALIEARQVVERWPKANLEIKTRQRYGAIQDVVIIIDQRMILGLTAEPFSVWDEITAAE